MNVAASLADLSPNNLEAYWMPFTANRQFKSAPRLFVSAEGMYYKTREGREMLDAAAGLWCVNAGHCREEIVEAVQAQVATMDYSPAFQMGHPAAFELASRVSAISPGDMDHVFFVNSGSEAVDTALKIAIAYHQARGQAGRFRLIGRERGFHGVGFGGMSVGGIVANRKTFGPLLNTDHITHTHNLEHNAFSKGQPEWGAHLADDLERVVALHGGETIAAVIVEPMAGSTGVLIPPKCYLKRLREICDRHGILLIFDEVITGFGRLGANFAAEKFGVLPDMITCAKGITNGTVPMGAVIARKHVYDAFMEAAVGDNTIELFHGYTYSGHPLACAAGLAALDIYRDDGLFERAESLSGYFEDAVHGLKDSPYVIDIRNLGLVAGIELTPREGRPTARAFDAFLELYERGILVRTTGDIIALSPPLIIEKEQIDRIVETINEVLKTIE